MIRTIAAIVASVVMIGSVQAATFKVTASKGDGLIFVEGAIVDGDAATLKIAADRFRTATVVLESNGGSLVNGIAMAELIHARGLSTMIPDGATCASVCASMWLAGSNRSMGPSSRVGFHSAYLMVDGRAQASDEANAKLSAFHRDIGLGDAAIRYITMAGPGSMTWMTEGAARSMGIQYAVLGRPRPAAPSMPVATASLGKATVYRDLGLRAASFNEPKSTSPTQSCRMMLLPDGDDTGDSFIAVDIPRKGKVGFPVVTAYTKGLETAGQPRVITVGGELVELDRGSNWGTVPSRMTNELLGTMQATGTFEVTSYRIDGSVAHHRYSSRGIVAAIARTARDCGKRA